MPTSSKIVAPTRHKIVFLGDQGVGKSSLAYRFVYDIFDDKYQPTVGIDFMTRNIVIDDIEIRLQIWDTAGQERFRCLIHNYIRDSNVALIVFDITKPKSFRNIREWIGRVREERDRDEIIVVVIGNKTDQEEKRKVSYRDASSFAERLGYLYIETSAKTGYNVRLLFTKLAKDLFVRDYMRRIKEKEEANKDDIINIYKSAEGNKSKCC